MHDNGTAFESMCSRRPFLGLPHTQPPSTLTGIQVKSRVKWYRHTQFLSGLSSGLFTFLGCLKAILEVICEIYPDWNRPPPSPPPPFNYSQHPKSIQSLHSKFTRVNKPSVSTPSLSLLGRKTGYTINWTQRTLCCESKLHKSNCKALAFEVRRSIKQHWSLGKTKQAEIQVTNLKY